MQPKTADVLSVIGSRGVIVGSWPSKRETAKDLDVVIRPVEEGRNPVYLDCLSRWRDHCDSVVPGHMTVFADPMPVEIFEDLGWLPADDAKASGALTYRSARRNSIKMDAYGVEMLAAT